MSGKGKGPAKKKAKHTEQLPMELDRDDDVSSIDSNSSWEIDPNQTIMPEDDARPDETYHLPAELEQNADQIPDTDSEEEDDHTGLWRPGDLDSLVLALNHYRPKLKGKFWGTSGGKKRRDLAWYQVAGNNYYIYIYIF